MRFILSLFLVSSHLFTIAQERFYLKLSDAAIDLTKQLVAYDPSYFSIAYPNGDVPANKGVCADVIIRAYNNVGGGQVMEDCLFRYTITGHYQYNH